MTQIKSNDNNYKLNIFNKLEKYLNNDGQTSKFIDAKVKLLKFDQYGINVDITLDNQNAIKNTEMIKA